MEVEVQGAGSDTSQPLTVAKRLKLINRWAEIPGASILDGGCGAGGHVRRLLAAGAIAKGVEFESDKVAQWERENPGNDAVKRGDLQHLEFSDEAFDVVLLNEVLEHVPDQDAALGEVWRVLKPGGRLFLFSPNRFHPFETHGYLRVGSGDNTGALRTFGMPYVPDRWRPKGLQAWARNYWPWELKRLTQTHGFTVVAQTYVWQTLENISGGQSKMLQALSPYVRPVLSVAELTPLVRVLGVSQLIVAEKGSVAR